LNNIKEHFSWLIRSKRQNPIRKNHIIIYKGKSFVHLFWGFFIRRFFSLRIKRIHQVNFLNDKQQKLVIEVSDPRHLTKYKDLPGYSVNKKLIWKK
jgi:hypothetical protein